jgi:hypothetical protein
MTQAVEAVGEQLPEPDEVKHSTTTVVWRVYGVEPPDTLTVLLVIDPITTERKIYVRSKRDELRLDEITSLELRAALRAAEVWRDRT